MVPSLACSAWVAWACQKRDSSCQISILCEGGDVWSRFQAAETTSQAAVPTEPEAAQTLLGLMGRMGLGEKQASAAILSQEALGLRFVPRAQFPFAECSSSKRVLGRLEVSPRCVPPNLAIALLLGPVQQGFFMRNQPSSRRRTRSELVSSCGHHQPSSSAHGARGSPAPPWPSGEHRAR